MHDHSNEAPLVRRTFVTLALALLAWSLCGCFNPFQPPVSSSRGVSSPPPVPNSPANAIRLLEWCYNNRDIDVYREVFTDDYTFIFGLSDTAGNAYRDRPYRREDELESATNLFVGGGDNPPASRITLTFDRTLIAIGDSRPGFDPRWHKSILTNVNLSVQISDGDNQQSLEVTGKARYYVVRGDSARIPDELVQRGFRPDSTRWWVERWEDETLPSGSVVWDPGTLRVRPGSDPLASQDGVVRMTMGELKSRFQSRPFLLAAPDPKARLRPLEAPPILRPASLHGLSH